MKEKTIKYLEDKIKLSKQLRYECLSQEETDLYHREVKTYEDVLRFVKSSRD